jgi:hypothetical protein
MKTKTAVPSSPEEWLDEITSAYLDAREAIPFGVFVDQVIKEQDLYHMAPAVCLRFRGLKQSDKLLKQATDAALTSYVATRHLVGEILDIPQMAFAFCYLASHFGLDLVDQELVDEVMTHVEREKESLVKKTSSEQQD